MKQSKFKISTSYPLLITVLAVALSISFLLPDSNSIKETKKMNILFIIADDLRPELYAFGASQIISPNIDALAKSGATFQRAYCNIPVCGASRGSLLSGIRPGKYRFYSHLDKLNEHYPGATSIPRLFKENGYTTISNGKIFHHKSDEKDIWDEMWQAASANGSDYVDPSNIKLLEYDADHKNTHRGLPYENYATNDRDYKDGKMAIKVIEDLRKLQKSTKPFFLTVGFHKPHLPFNAPKKYWDMYDINKIQLPPNYFRPSTTPGAAYHNSEELTYYHDVPQDGMVTDEYAINLIHGYYACVSYMDAQLGMIMDELKRLKMDQNTVVMLIGDHGYNLGDHKMWNKHCNFASSLTTPLILQVPKLTKGQKITEIVEFVDIMPTLLKLANIPVPSTADGESIVPLLQNEKKVKDYAISKWENGLTVIKGQYFYTEWQDDDKKTYARMLFDHKSDPFENNNLAEKLEFKDKVATLSALLKKNRGEEYYTDRRVIK